MIRHLLFFVISMFCVTTLLNAQEILTNPETKQIQLLPEVSLLPDINIQQKTHPEKIIFTQIKLAGDLPDFDQFAKLSPNVRKAQDIDKNAVTLSEYNRLSNSFNMHDEKSEIIVHTTIQADEYSSLQDMIVFDEFDETSFFQFRAYGHRVAIVPEQIDRFSKLALSKVSAERFFRTLNGKSSILAEFTLVPTFSDNKKPLVINDHNIWLMSARVAEFRLWSNTPNPELLWYFRAPWYSPQNNTNIQELYAKP